MSNAGAVLATFTYDSYGSLTASTGTATTPLLWQGQYLDATSGLYYLRARYYDPTTGQFLTVDPLVTTTNAPYTYAGDNPINAADPLGLWSLNPFQDVGQAWNDTLGKAVHFAYTHPAIAAGVALGIASVATGGAALAVGATWVGVGLGATAVATGAAATFLDAGACAKPGPGRLSACIGASLGGVGALTGLGATAGAGLVVGGVVAEGSIADIGLNGVIAGLSFTSAGAGLAFDSAVGLGSALSASTCHG